MNTPSPSMHELARRLLTANRTTSLPDGGRQIGDVVAVFASLRVSLTRFAGADGFGALLRRALALARVEAPVLASVRVGANGEMEGLADVAARTGGQGAVIALAAHLLTLLVTFIGEPLTLRLIHAASPGAELDGSHPQNEG